MSPRQQGPRPTTLFRGRRCSPCGGTAARAPRRRCVSARRTRASAHPRTSTRAAAGSATCIPSRRRDRPVGAMAAEPAPRAVAAAAAIAAAAAMAAVRMATAACVQKGEYILRVVAWHTLGCDHRRLGSRRGRGVMAVVGKRMTRSEAAWALQRPWPSTRGALKPRWWSQPAGAGDAAAGAQQRGGRTGRVFFVF